MPEYRVRFTKEEHFKFLSHLELIRTIERALKRANIPMAYSEGFHPHPKLSFGPALAVGLNSIDEYFDMQLTIDLETEILITNLNQNLPQGIKVTAIKKCTRHVKPLNAIINRAAYIIVLKVESNLIEAISDQLHQLMTLSEIVVSRQNKNGQKMVNIRPWLHNLSIEAINDHQLQLHFTGEIGSGGNLRPEDLISQITYPVEVEKIVRVGLWHEEKDNIVKPLDLC